ncbi:MAG: hypothetical protein IH991_18650 [Planctomycetes bacterium]|nr:hypothetical protein [Planctomycetota bacterium]
MPDSQDKLSIWINVALGVTFILAPVAWYAAAVSPSRSSRPHIDIKVDEHAFRVALEKRNEMSNRKLHELPNRQQLLVEEIVREEMLFLELVERERDTLLWQLEQEQLLRRLFGLPLYDLY